MKRLLMFGLVVFAVAAWGQQEPLAPVDLTVRVLDESGASVEGTEVVCVRWFLDEPPRTEPVRDPEKGMTDAEGRCVFSGLVGDEYATYAFRGDFSAFERVYPHRLNGAQFDLKLAPHPPVNIQLRDLHGQPAEGVLVLAYGCVPLAHSDGEGRIRFPSLSRHPLGFAKQGYGYFSYDFPEGDIEIFLMPGAVLEFTVVDEEGAPVPGAKANYLGYEATADAEGRFRTIELPRDARIYGSARHTSATAHWSGNIDLVVGAGPVQQAEIRLKKTAEVKPSGALGYPGAPYPGGRVAVAAVYAQAETPRTRGAMTPLEVHYLSGKVVMADTGKPVQARLYSGDERERYYMRPCGRTGPDGTFRLDTNRLGAYFYVHPEDGRYYAVESPVQIPRDKSMENLVFTVKPGCSLRGHVVDHEGKPAGRTWVILEALARYPIQVLPDERGYFTITHLPPVSDHYVLRAERETRVEVPAAQPGTIIDNIVIKLPPADEGSLVEGVVVDGQGAPAGGVNLQFQQQVRDEKTFEHGQTDSRGRFSLRFKNTGPVSVEVWKIMQVKMGEMRSNTGRPCPVREGGQFDVAAGGPPQQVRIVVDVPPPDLLLVAGWVEDDQGRPVEAKLKVYGERSSAQAHMCSNSFLIHNARGEEPFLLEFTLEGYQARVLELNRDFTLRDRSVRVVMKKGPYGEKESIWAAATGRPNTEEAVAAMLMGDRIKQQETEYERLAGRKGVQPAQPVERSAILPVQAPTEVEIAVTDPRGRPVKEIAYRAAVTMGPDYQLEIRQDNAVEAPDAPKSSLSDPNGRYRVPNQCLVGSQGTAQRLVAVRPGEVFDPPLAITLGPAASVTVRVEDMAGEPQAGVAVGPLDDMGQHNSNNYYYLPKTGADGRVRFDNLPAGFYVYGAAMPITSAESSMRSPYEEVAAARVTWGESAEEVIRVGSPKPGSVEAMMVEWRQSIWNLEVIDQAVAALGKERRQRLEQAVLEQLRAVPVIVGLNNAHVTVLARVAAALECRKAVEPLKKVFPSARDGIVFDQATQAIMDALVRLRGEAMTGYFESVARDPEASRDARVQALVALGRIGTNKTVAAFKRLRDAAYGKNGAPERRPTYTYGERMAEAAAMILYYIPGGAGQAPVMLNGNGTSVSADYNEGRMMYSHYNLHFRRFKDEWLLVEMESMPMP